MPHRVVVDLLGYTGRRGGTETYARELMIRLPALLPDVEWVALSNRRGAPGVRSFFPGEVRVLRWVGADRVTWALGAVLGVATAARRARASVVWCPANFGPITRRTARIVTVHDAIYHTIEGRLLARCVSAATSWLMTRSARTADAVITVSHAAAGAIEQHMGVLPNKITVIPNGTGEPAPPSQPWELLQPLGIHPGRRIVLSAGNRLPHKNLPGLLRALRTIPPAQRPLLVVAGGGSDDPLIRDRAAMDLVADVVLPGWVTTEQLEALYSIADLYVCPSLNEGFGLPVLDALRRGIPVVASDIPVLREVGGTVARYADATDPEAFGSAMAEALQTPSRAGDKSGREDWAKRFNWEASASAVASVMSRMVSRGSETKSRREGREEH